jgi:NAD(P)H dehydrogenase (quinone)
MSITNLLIIFYSTYRTNQAIATEAAKAAEEAGVSVRLRRIAETAPVEVVKNQDGWKAQVEKAAAVELVSEEDLECSDALFLSSSTRSAGMRSYCTVSWLLCSMSHYPTKNRLTLLQMSLVLLVR